MDSTEGLRSSVADLRAIAREILERTADFESSPDGSNQIYDSKNNNNISDIPQLYALAKEELRNRQDREIHFDVSLFGEPAWDILLDLFAHKVEGKLVSVSSVSIASGVPNTTALRWIGLLEQRSLVRRVASPTDKRVSWLDLSDDAFKCVSATLRSRLHNQQSRPILFR
jgi:hypothetical protein